VTPDVAPFLDRPVRLCCYAQRVCVDGVLTVDGDGFVFPGVDLSGVRPRVTEELDRELHDCPDLVLLGDGFHASVYADTEHDCPYG
jgi:hypothetical protein